MPGNAYRIEHPARLIALARAREYGWLNGMTLTEIGDRLGVNRSTAMRNIRELDQIADLVEKYIADLGPAIPVKSQQYKKPLDHLQGLFVSNIIFLFCSTLDRSPSSHQNAPR